jgi:hypothetical protein
MQDLVDVLRARQIAEVDMAQIEQRDARRQTLAQQRRYRFRQQYLPPWAAAIASRTIDRRTKVVVVAVLDDSPCNPQRTRALHRWSRLDPATLAAVAVSRRRANGSFGRGVNATAGHFYDDAAIVLHCATGDRVMARQRRPHPFGLFVP